MTDPKQFDVFISYRNSYYETRPDGTKRKIDVGFGVAKEVAFLLNYKKYRVYFDNFTLSGGDDYERHIFTSIPACRDVILVLVPQALDRCTGENDIFGREIVAALEGGKNIIPVFVNGFSFPETVDELPEMLRGPAKTFQEKTGRSFVRLQGAKVQASETISAENSRIIKNTIFAEVIPYLKSVPGINRQDVPDDITVKPPFGSGKKKMLIKAALAAAVVLAGAAAYLKMELSSPEETAAGTLPPPPQAQDEISVAGTDEVAEAAQPSAPARQDAATSGDESDSADAAAADEPEAVPAPPEKPSADVVPASGDEAKSADVPAGDSAEAEKSVSEPTPVPAPEPPPASVEELVAAVKDGDAERVNAILDSGTDVNAVAENGATALCSAVLRGDFEIVSALLDSGANPNFAMSENGMTPLHIAAARNDVVATKLLIAAGADVSVRTKDGLLPVDFADDEEIKKLLENLAK